MLNLFNYATKELSQDAFLRWFLECANENDDISYYAKEFLSFLTNNACDAIGISDVHTTAQYKKIDIIVDFKCYGKPAILIIEDKVDTSEHSNQLQRYRDIVESFEDPKGCKRQRYYVYYKTDYITSEERYKVHNIAKYDIFDIGKINTFFEELDKSDNVILEQYREYISKKWEDQSTISNKPVNEWNFNNWRVYLKSLNLTGKHCKVEDWIWNGKCLCYAFYFDTQDPLSKICFELRIEKGMPMLGNLHIVTYYDRDKSEWLRIDGQDQTWEKVYSLFAISEMKTLKPKLVNSWRSNTRMKTVASLRKKIELDSKEHVAARIAEVINEIKLYFKGL